MLFRRPLLALLVLLAATLSLTSCDSRCRKPGSDPAPVTPPPAAVADKVLLLQVDYLTNTFEGGSELSFASSTPTFTVTTDYQSPGDFGNIRLNYQELNQPLFDGSIVWMGRGERHFPQNLTPASQFTATPLLNIVYPGGGYDNVFNPNNETHDYDRIWQSVQALNRVRDYVASNPTASVKLFLYTPSVGMGNPADWKWILLLKGGAVSNPQ